MKIDQKKSTRFAVTGMLLIIGWFCFSSKTAFAQTPTDELNQRLATIRDQMQRVASAMQSELPNQPLNETQKAIADELRLLVQQFSAGEQTGSSSAVPQQAPGATQSASSQGSGTAAADSPGDEEQPTNPASDSGDADLILKAWGQMPGELREERGSGISPQFLPKYEHLIREYYRRISR